MAVVLVVVALSAVPVAVAVVTALPALTGVCPTFRRTFAKIAIGRSILGFATVLAILMPPVLAIEPALLRPAA